MFEPLSLWYFLMQQLITKDQHLRHSTTQPWLIYSVVFLKISQNQNIYSISYSSLVLPLNTWFSFPHLCFFPWCVLYKEFSFHPLYPLIITCTFFKTQDPHLWYNIYSVFLSFNVKTGSNLLYGKHIQLSRSIQSSFQAYFKIWQKLGKRSTVFSISPPPFGSQFNSAALRARWLLKCMCVFFRMGFEWRVGFRVQEGPYRLFILKPFKNESEAQRVRGLVA